LNYINEILYIRDFKVIEKFLLSLHYLTRNHAEVILNFDKIYIF